MKGFLISVFFLITFSNVYSQLDTRHYIPPFYGREDLAEGGGEDIFLLISTPQTVAFDVIVTDGAGNPLPFSPVSVSRSTPFSIELSNGGVGKGPNTKFLISSGQLAMVQTDEGLILTANKAFFANIRVDESAQAGFLTSKGTAGFGTEFRSGHIWNVNVETNRKAHVFSFMATEDNTTVNISDFGAVDFQNITEPGSGIISVNLDAGESYVLAAHADAASANLNEVNGTRISSDKSIVVNSGSWLAGSPSDGNQRGRDIGIDQIAPIEQTGFEYILVKGEGTANENVIVVAHTDGTNIFLNGSSSPSNSTPLDAGDYFRFTASDYTANENMYITSNQPVYVYQGLNGSLSTNERQLGLNYIPPIVCLGGTNVDLADINQLGNPVIQIIAETGATVEIDNGTTVTDVSASAQSVTGNSNYVTYKLTGYSGDVTVTSPRPIRVALTIESGNVGGAGFFSGFTTAPVIETPNGYNATTCIPDNLPVTLDATGFDSYQWYRDDILLVGETNSSISVNSPGTYTAAGAISGCVSSEQSFPLTVSLCPGDLGIAKNKVSTTNVSGALFDVVFDLVVTNYSTTNPAPNIQITDDIIGGLPAGATASIQVTPIIQSGAFAAGGISSSFDGDSDLALLSTSASSVDTELAAASSVSIRYTVRVDMTSATTPAYTNQAIVSTALVGPNDGVTATFDNQDFSDNGTDPDPNGNGDPTETGENDATEVCLSNTTISYSSPIYFTTGTDPTPTISGLTGGVFSSPSGLMINSSTGQIDVSTSIVDIYTVTYSFGGLCATTTTVEIALNPPAEPTVISQTTNNTTPSIMGAADIPSGGTLTVEVDNMIYTLGDGNLSISGTTWTLVVPSGNEITPDNTYEVEAIIDDGIGGFTSDLTSGELIIDTAAPTVDIIGEPALVDNTSSYTVTIEFSEDVVGLDVTDIVVGNGAASNLVSIDGNTYEVDITPSGSNNITIDVAAGVVQDNAGNNNTVATQAITEFESEAVYTVNTAQNVDSYADNNQLASVVDANGTGVTNAVLASGSLPAGFALNATTGEITVSDASLLVAGTYNLDITTTDSEGGITNQTVTIVIDPDTEAVYTVNAAQNVDSYADNDQLASVVDANGTGVTNAVLASGTLPAGFALNATTGEITVSDASLLVAGTYNLDITTTDSEGGTTNQTVTIALNGDSEAVYTVAPSQNVDSYADNDQLASVVDANGTGVTNAVLASGTLPAGFALNATTGEITVSDANSLIAGTYNLDITTTDSEGGTTNQTVTVVIGPDTESVYTVNAAQNVDSYANNDQLASVVDANGAGVTNAVLASGSLPAGFALNATTGEITVSDASLLVAGTYNLDITTTDSEGGTTSQTVTIVINGDTESVYTVNAAQNVDSYTDNDQLASVVDANGTGVTNAVLASGSLPAGFALNATTGEITVSDASLLVAGTYNLDITTTDSEGGTTNQTVTIVLNGDSEAVYTVNAAQNVDSYADNDQLASVVDANGTGVTNAVLASGSLPGGFMLNATTGEITVNDASLLVAGAYNLDITTTDSEGGTTNQTVTIVLNGDNEEVYTVNSSQNIDSYNNADVLATVVDGDGTGIVSATVTAGSLPAGVQLSADGSITVSDASLLTAGTFTFSVTTVDSEGGTTVTPITLIFDGDTESVYTVNAAQNVDSYADNDQLASVVDANGTGVTNAVLASGSLPAGFALNATTGEITVSDASLLVAGTYNLDITTTDSEGGITNQTVTVVIDPDTEAIYTVNTAQNVDSYNNTDVLATAVDSDGTGIISATVTTGSLPAGVQLNADGSITVSDATLLTAGTFTFSVTTVDSEGGTTVTPPITLIFDGDTEAVYTVNTAQNVDSYADNDQLASVVDANGTGVTNAVLASGSLPAGFALNATTGEITVSDASLLVAGTYNLDVTTTDSEGGKTNQTVTVVIDPDTESVYTVNAAQNVDSYADNDQLASVVDANGAGVTNAVLASGSLPGGFVLNATTGEITVSDASLLVAGTYNLDITTTDSEGGRTNRTVTIVLDGDSEAVYTVNPSQNIDSYNNADVLATAVDGDGTGIVLATVTSGSLPAGVQLNADGSITVSDASLLIAGTFTFGVTTVDSDGGETVTPITLTFDGDTESVYTVNAAQNVDGYVDNDQLALVVDANGTGVTNAVLASGSLPAGFALNATTGEITVSDASLLVAGTYNLDITTTDSEGGTTNQTVTIVLNGDSEAVYTVNAAQNVDSYADNDQLASVVDANGTGVTNAVLASGSLPAGFALNVTTGEITVSDASLLVAGTYNLDITTTDSEGGTTNQTVTIVLDGDSEAIYTVNPSQNVDSYNNADILATAVDGNGTGIASATVTTGSLPAGVQLNADGSIMVSDASLLTAGTFTFSVTTVDSDGGETVTPITLTFDGDTESIYMVNAAQNVDSYADNDQLASVVDANGTGVTNAVLASGSLPVGFALNATTGEIIVSDTSLLVAGTYNLDITTTDSEGGTTNQTVTIVLDGDSEAIYTVNPSQNVDSYNNADVLATAVDGDGTGIVSATVTTGSLPAGVQLNADGSITVSDASLLTAGTFTFSVTTVDSDGGETVTPITLTFDGDTESVYKVNVAQNVDSYADNDQLASLVDANGTGVTNAVLASGSLPAGFALNATTGEITVSDASLLVAGAYNLDITSTDSEGGITNQTVTVVIDPDTESVYTTNPPQSVASYADNDRLASLIDSDGIGVKSAALTSGTLPAGFALNAMTGEITVGDASLLVAGTYNLDITTTDSEGGITNQIVTVDLLVDTDGDGDPDMTDPDDDNDGNPDGTDTNPLVATTAPDVLTTPEGVAGTVNVLSNDDFLPGANTSLVDAGTGSAGGTIVFDPLTGELMYTPLASEAGSTVTVDYTVCNTAVAPQVCSTETVTITIQTDTDGDGDPNVTDPDDDNDDNPDSTDTNPLVATTAPDTLTTPLSAAGTVNVLSNDDFLPGANTSLVDAGTGSAGGTIVFDPLTGELIYTPLASEAGSTVTVDYTVCNTAVAPQVCSTETVAITVQTDTDGDGDPDVTDPDDDNDANPDGTDTNPLVATTAPDVLTTPEGVAGTVNVLSNDDFLPGANTSLVDAGTGSAGGTIVFDPLTGELMYTPLASEAGTTVTIDYTVCNTAVAPQVCSTETVAITVQTDTDGDGDPDVTDPDDDNDGNPDGTDTNPLVATTAPDVLTTPEGVAGTVNVLSNDDFLPGANTSLVDAGTGSAGGTIVFDPLTGELMYTPLASEAGTTVTIDYTVCNTAVAPQVCSTETVTITVQSDSADSDGDGAPDNEDNCPNTSNSNQVDSDGDGIGDVCDDDRDGDGIVNDQDNCPDTPNADQADLDGDGLGDVCDDDTDGDGVSDNDEDLDGDGDPSNDDTDGDGTPDFEDTDDDGDGEDTAEEDTNGDGDRTNDDCNGDGIPDYLDADPCDGVVDPGEGFSPNGDGNNDGWVIENIENHPDNVVKVFNRWGNVVFETEDYDNQSNQWFGEVNGRLVLSDSEAPDGTYFYFIDLKDGNEPLSGYVIIKR